jgi:hypothetical protein
MSKIATEKLKIFNHNIIKHKVPIHLYNNILLKQDIIDTFNKIQILKNGSNSEEKLGKGYSTCGLGNYYVTNLKNITPLLNYISKIILKEFYNNTKNTKIFYDRMWINKIYKNCSGKCHTHEGSNDGSAIFYFDVPENGSKLIILKNKIDSAVTEKHKDMSYYVDVKTGDLILHRKNVPHAVSEHMSDNPRICFVFDFKLIDDTNYNNLNYT